MKFKKKKKRVYRKNKKDYIQFIIFLKKHMKFFLKKKGIQTNEKRLYTIYNFFKKAHEIQ